MWPGETYFPDFNQPNAFQFWSEGLANLTENYGGPQPSGIWIDMNEFSNFINGEVLPAQVDDGSVEGRDGFIPRRKPRTSYYDSPPFEPQGVLHPLYQRTLSVDGIHYSGPNAQFITSDDFGQTIYEWDWHNLNGFSEGIATNNYLKNTAGKKLTFILSRYPPQVTPSERKA